MKISQKDLTTATSVIKAAQRVVVISHQNPDPDTLGCNLALREALQALGKQAVSVCADPPEEKLAFLPGSREVATDFSPPDFDLAITVDTAHHNMLGFWEQKTALRDGILPTLQIDHHAKGNLYGTYQLVVTTAAATAIPIYYLLKLLKVPMTSSMATCLLAGLYYDTGSFMHPNTDAEVLDIAAKLVGHGADAVMISRRLFNTHRLPQLHLWGRALLRVHCNGKRIASSAVTAQDFQETATTPEDISGLIDYLNTLPQSQFVIMLHDNLTGQVKGSLRTRHDDVDVAKIAAIFGGGGHVKASGFTLPGSIRPRLTWEVAN